MEKTTKILNMYLEVYKKSWHDKPESKGARLFEACKDALYPNGMPLNVLKAVTIMENVRYLIDIKTITEIDYNNLVKYLSDLSGYSVTELNNRLQLGA